MLEIKAHAYERKKSSFLRRGKRREIELCRAKELGDMGRMLKGAQTYLSSAVL